VSDRVLRFPDRTWDELEGLPQPLRNAAHTAIFHLLDEPVPVLAEPFPATDPLPGAYRLHLPTDGLTINGLAPDGQPLVAPCRRHRARRPASGMRLTRFRADLRGPAQVESRCPVRFGCGKGLVPAG
jgi:hypothetical protein